jgi:hypothetical protein
MIVAAGLFNLAIAVFHVLLGRLLGWPEKLEGLDRSNRAAMRLLNTALIVLLTAIGLAFSFFTSDVRATALGQFLVAAMLMFWFVRLILQPIHLGWTSQSSLRAIPVLIVGVVLHAAALMATVR